MDTLPHCKSFPLVKYYNHIYVCAQFTQSFPGYCACVKKHVASAFVSRDVEKFNQQVCIYLKWFLQCKVMRFKVYFFILVAKTKFCS